MNWRNKMGREETRGNKGFVTHTMAMVPFTLKKGILKAKELEL
jgi:hypothetical protein